ncbi:MAG: hypothetical protein IKR81_06375 [Victivallales bacterium]|nr:hypothetical protein [Victivallales bacterium]
MSDSSFASASSTGIVACCRRATFFGYYATQSLGLRQFRDRTSYYAIETAHYYDAFVKISCFWKGRL